MSTQGTEHFMVNAHPHFPCIPSKDGINPNPRCSVGALRKMMNNFLVNLRPGKEDPQDSNLL